MKKHQLLCLALLALPGLLSGQTAINVGARVRAGTPTMRPTTGLLLGSTKDSLLIGFSNRTVSPVALSRSDLTLFKISQGGNGLHGAVVGAQIGIPAGAVVFGIEHLKSRRPPPRFSYDNGDLAFAALTGAAWGLVAGALAGAVVAQETWADVALPQPSDAALPSFDARPSLLTQLRLGLFPEGDAIRVRTQEGRQVQGSYEGYVNGLLRIAGDSSYLVPVSDIVEIAERRPMTGPWLRRGVLIGAALGVATIAVAAWTNDHECPPNSCIPAWAFTFHFGAGGALTGAALGAILGSHVKGWRPQKW